MNCRTLGVAFSGVLATGLLLTGSGDAVAAKKAPRKPVVSVTKFDPAAREVELFEAMAAGEIETRVLAKDEFHAKVLIENKTDEPLNVKFPKAVITAPILAQFGGGGMGGMGGGMGGGGMGGGGMGGGGGGGQMGGGGMGGGMGGMGGGGGGMGGMGGGMGGMGGGGGGGFFSVPPEKIVSIPLNTVCLEHGKKEPNLTMKYKLVPIELVTKDPLMPEFLAMVGTGKLNQPASQAAAWHIANKMSWQQLAAKEKEQLGGLPPEPYFAPQQLAGAQQILALAKQRADNQPAQEEKEEKTEPKKTTPRTTRVSELKP